MKYLVSVLILFCIQGVQAQDTLTLEQCIMVAEENAPRLRDRQLMSEEARLTVDNIRSSWYPELTLNGKVSYQSDVVSIELEQPAMSIDFPEMPHGQYGLNLDLRQTLYDGGYARKRILTEQAVSATSAQAVEVDLYTLREQVTRLYFSILLLQENRNNFEILLENLQSREAVLQSGISHGVTSENDLNVIRVEIIKTLQSISELDARKTGLVGMLNIYMGKNATIEAVLVRPYLEINTESGSNRPELRLFDLQSAVLDANRELTSVKRLPRFFAYGQAGVGMPGYNMLNDEIDSYYLVGAGLHWNVWDWNNVKREKEILEVKKQVVQNSREQFNMATEAAMEEQIRYMEHYRNALNLDDKMVEMRISISANAASRLENGVITATEYLLVINEENMARISRSTHQVQLLNAMATYKLLKGTL